MMPETHFLNVDLDLVSADDLSSLIQEFGDDVIVMNDTWLEGEHHVSFELGAGESIEPDYLIECFYTLVQKLSTPSKLLWKNCKSRVFDLGFESGTTPRSYHAHLSVKTIESLSKIDAQVAITIYGNIEK